MAEIPATSEQIAVMLTMTKVDLGILSATVYDTRLAQYLTAAGTAIYNVGAQLDYTDHNDRELCVEYAAWLWRRRDSHAGMGDGLRHRLHSRIVQASRERSAVPEG